MKKILFLVVALFVSVTAMAQDQVEICKCGNFITFKTPSGINESYAPIDVRPAELNGDMVIFYEKNTGIPIIQKKGFEVSNVTLSDQDPLYATIGATFTNYNDFFTNWADVVLGKIKPSGEGLAQTLSWDGNNLGISDGNTVDLSGLGRGESLDDFDDIDIVLFGDSIAADPTGWVSVFDSIVNPNSLDNQAVPGQQITWEAGTVESTANVTTSHADNVIWNAIKKWEENNPTAEPDVFMLYVGTNDFNMPLGTFEDAFAQDINSTSHLTFASASRRVLYYLRDNYPKSFVYWITPTQSGMFGRRYDDLLPYVDLIKQMCARHSINIIDAYFESGIFGDIETSTEHIFLDSDRLHLNEEGDNLVGKFIANRFIYKSDVQIPSVVSVETTPDPDPDPASNLMPAGAASFTDSSNINNWTPEFGTVFLETAITDGSPNALKAVGNNAQTLVATADVTVPANTTLIVSGSVISSRVNRLQLLTISGSDLVGDSNVNVVTNNTTEWVNGNVEVTTKTTATKITLQLKSTADPVEYGVFDNIKIVLKN